MSFSITEKTKQVWSLFGDHHLLWHAITQRGLTHLPFSAICQTVGKMFSQISMKNLQDTLSNWPCLNIHQGFFWQRDSLCQGCPRLWTNCTSSAWSVSSVQGLLGSQVNQKLHKPKSWFVVNISSTRLTNKAGAVQQSPEKSKSV